MADTKHVLEEVLRTLEAAGWQKPPTEASAEPRKSSTFVSTLPFVGVTIGILSFGAFAVLQSGLDPDAKTAIAKVRDDAKTAITKAQKDAEIAIAKAGGELKQAQIDLAFSRLAASQAEEETRRIAALLEESNQKVLKYVETSSGRESLEAAVVLARIGRASLKAGNYGKARDALDQSIRILDKLLSTKTKAVEPQQAQVLLDLATALLKSNELPNALIQATHSLALFRKLMDRHGEAEALALLGQINEARGEIHEAQTHLEQAREIHQGTGDWNKEVRTLHTQSELFRKAGQEARANELRERAAVIVQKHGAGAPQKPPQKH